MEFDINSFLRELSIAAVPFLMAITVHEASHGYAAYMLGDDTAKRAGRLTLNPLKHLDPLGLLVLFLTRLFGWAKPVPVNFTNLNNKKYGPAIVAGAGPTANFITAILSSGLYNIIINLNVSQSLHSTLIVPLALMALFSIQINIALGIFNLIPVLPLDGGRILQSFLPLNAAYKFSQTEQYGFVIIIILLLTNVIDRVVFPIINVLVNLLT